MIAFRPKVLLLAGALAAAGPVACQVEMGRLDVREERLKAIDRAQAQQAAQLTVVRDDGSVTLNSPRPEHLVAHLRQQIVEGNVDLIHDQLLSDAAKALYSQRGLDSHDAAHWLIANQRDVLILLNRMTAGLSSPEVISEAVDQGYRLRIAPHLERSFRFTTLDIVRENGQFRLLLIS